MDAHEGRAAVRHSNAHEHAADSGCTCYGTRANNRRLVLILNGHPVGQDPAGGNEATEEEQACKEHPQLELVRDTAGLLKMLRFHRVHHEGRV